MKVKRYFRFCIMLLKFKLSRQMVYSFSFWTAFFVDMTVFLMQIAVFSTVFLQVNNINGWNKYQMIFFVGTFTIIDSLYMSTYFFGVINIPEKIRTGRLDLYLTKPMNALFYISFESMDIGSIILTIPGIMMLVYISGRLGIEPNFVNVAGYIVLIIIMLILMYDLMVIVRSAAFWFTRTDSITEFESEMVNFSFRVPGVVYSGAVKLILYVILPYGLMATIPTMFFTDFLSGRYWVMTIVVCAVFTLLCQIIWKLGLRHYDSASC